MSNRAADYSPNSLSTFQPLIKEENGEGDWGGDYKGDGWEAEEGGGEGEVNELWFVMREESKANLCLPTWPIFPYPLSSARHQT